MAVMLADSLAASVEHAKAELRALHPEITDCEAALVQWKDGEQRRYSLALEIRWPQHQTLVSGPVQDEASAAIHAALRLARERLARYATPGL